MGSRMVLEEGSGVGWAAVGVGVPSSWRRKGGLGGWYDEERAREQLQDDHDRGFWF